MTPAILFFFLGSIYGSFLNMLLWRLPREEGIGGRSHCPHCRQILRWYDLVPIISYLVLSGRCRSCKQGIATRYLIVEIISGLFFVLFFMLAPYNPGLEISIYTFSLLIFIALFFFDLYYFILPDILVFPAMAIFTVYNLIFAIDPASYFLTSLLLATFFAIIYLATRGKKLGFGDVKLVILIGLVLGYPLGFMAVVLGIWLAALVSIILLLLRLVTRKDAIPLGSFLALASIFCLIFSYELIPFAILFK